METYSPYFTTLHDEQQPTGHLGRGTHYSVLRAVSWHSPNFGISDRAYYHDFAIIWDEDHDTRVIGCVEEIYLNGLLSKFTMFGERKAFFSAVVTDDYVGGNTDRELAENLTWIAENFTDGDCWASEIFRMDGDSLGIISDSPEKVHLYLNNIKMLWQLGGKPVPSAAPEAGTIPFPIKFR